MHRTALCLSIVLLLLAGRAEAKTELFLEADDPQVWSQLEQGIRLQLDGDWQGALKVYLALAEQAGDRLVAAPPPGLVRKVEAWRRLLADLKGSPLDAGKLSWRDDASFLAWKKVGQARFEAALAAARKEFPAAKEEPLRQTAQSNLVQEILSREYGITPPLAEIARRHNDDLLKGGLLGLIRGLHAVPLGASLERTRGVTRYVSLLTYVATLLGELPPAGRKVYGSLFGPEARRLLAAGGERQREPLERLVEGYLGLPETALALDRLGEWALERGDLAEAVERWGRLLRLFPRGAAGVRPAGVVARLATVHALRGEPQAVEELRRSHGEAAGQRVTVAGREVALSAHLQAMAELAGRHDGRRARGWLREGELRLDSIAGLIGRIDYGMHLMNQRMPGRHTGRSPSDYFPLVDEAGWLYLRGPAGLASFELGSLKRHRQVEFSGVRSTLFSRKPQHELAPGFYSSLVPGALLLTYPTGTTESPSSALVCLDRATLQERWRRPRAGEADKVLKGGLISAVLAAGGGRVYAGVTSTEGDIGSHVYCFDLQRGDLLWQRFLCSRHRGERPVFPLAALALRGPTLYVTTGQGVAAALAASTGRIEWLARYDELPEELRLAAGDGRNRWLLQPPLVIGDRVIFASPDAPRAPILLAATGAETESYPGGNNERLRHLLGVGEDGVIYFGGSRVDAWSEQPRDPRLVAQSDLQYDLEDEREQLSDWRLRGWLAAETDKGTLYATLERQPAGYAVSLYRSRFKRPGELVARGELRRGKQGVVTLESVGPRAKERTAQVTLDWKGGDRTVLLRVLPEVHGRAALIRDQVLVPTADGVLRLDRRRGLRVIGLWRGLEEYEAGNLQVVGRAGGPALLIVAGPTRLVVYRGKPADR